MACETPDEKNALRALFRVRRRELAAADPAAAERVAEAVPAELLTRFSAVAGYCAIAAELDPEPLMRRFRLAGSQILLPAAVKRDQPLVFRITGDPHGFVADALGVPAPPPSAREGRPSLVLVPVVAFDRRGGRLGQGAGCYDKTLEALRAAWPVFALGLAYAGQEYVDLPVQPHDQRLDAILTEKGYIEVKRGSP